MCRAKRRQSGGGQVSRPWTPTRLAARADLPLSRGGYNGHSRALHDSLAVHGGYDCALVHRMRDKRMKRITLDPYLPVVGVVGLIIVWYIAVYYEVVDKVLLPSPNETFRALW